MRYSVDDKYRQFREYNESNESDESNESNESDKSNESNENDEILIPPDLFLRDASEEDIYCRTVGVVTPLTLNIAKKMTKLLDFGMEQSYSTLYGQDCLTSHRGGSLEDINYSPVY
jgi:hypothetical protein